MSELTYFTINIILTIACITMKIEIERSVFNNVVAKIAHLLLLAIFKEI